MLPHAHPLPPTGRSQRAGPQRAGRAQWQAAEGHKQQAALREGSAALQLEAESVARSLKAVTTVSQLP